MALYSMGRRRVIVLLVLTSILLITLDLRGNALIDRGRSVMALLLEPFDSAARTMTGPVINAWNGVVNYDELRRENESLRAEIDTQRGAEIEARASILEYQELLTLNRLLGSGGYPTVTAQVQGAAPSNFQYTVEINKGSTDGIAVGMPVVNGGGLVGKISRVFPNSSIVLLVIDPDFGIGAKVLTEGDPLPTTTTTTTVQVGSGQSSETTTTLAPTGPLAPPSAATTTTTSTAPTSSSTSSTAPTPTTSTPTTSTTAAGPGVEIIRETGALTGQGANRRLLLRFIDDSSTEGRVKVGSTVQTAGGIQSIAPAGLPIGKVASIDENSGSRSLRVEVDLAAGDLSKLSFVRVLLYMPSASGS